ncbi:HAD-IA family hydrolase [Roseospira marina]|uniref:HAD-IA family hydrolase n=1 Tax=Roseospira marina TaxID=140057 RepID=A0A5M6IHK1_9PROT|nr:HAD-IA family hydrolase [Roseospira marina]KAA5607642.1 HAD-IA family hydrolase [Roseospira marina]MBB4312157.1 phosphoglycolate phosphatase [Roseospira marina]MBB5085827.1 phosphoglycolate phosphatase [Roseospira marina]
MTPLRLVVFDVDGTLVDSQHNIIAAMAMACEGAGVAVPPASATRGIIGLSLGEAIAAVTPAADPAQRARVETLYKEAFFTLRSRPDHEEPLFPGALEMIDAVEAGGALLGIATGKSRRGVAAALERHGLEGRFLTVQTADEGPGKPHPAMLMRAMVEVGAEPSDTSMIGDTSFDMTMARAARVDAIGVAWGYHPAAALTEAGARVVAAVCADVPALVAEGPGVGRVLAP